MGVELAIRVDDAAFGRGQLLAAVNDAADGAQRPGFVRGGTHEESMMNESKPVTTPLAKCVIPAKAGTQGSHYGAPCVSWVRNWIPAFAGMTVAGQRASRTTERLSSYDLLRQIGL